MASFEQWDKEFREQHFDAFNCNAEGLLWLKVRAVCRGKQIGQFLAANGMALGSRRLADQNRELFGLLGSMPDGMQRLDRFLNAREHEWYEGMGIDEGALKEDLYKVRYYEWGGDQNNSLDRHLVSRYVKAIGRYDDLLVRRDEIAENAWNYVQASWYNNWTSYLIESLFKRHGKVVSAVGEIKSVDFFLYGYPIDLKVTYFPNQYMDERLKVKLGCSELAWLKRKAREVGLTVDAEQSKSQQIYILSEKLSEKGRQDILNELKTKRKEVVVEAQEHTTDLMRWLYSHQGEMRFGAENRLFLILVDMADMSQSWKMKRAFSLIEPLVKSYLDSFSADSLKEVCFTFKGKDYKSLADTIFVVKE